MQVGGRKFRLAFASVVAVFVVIILLEYITTLEYLGNRLRGENIYVFSNCRIIMAPEWVKIRAFNRPPEQEELDLTRARPYRGGVDDEHYLLIRQLVNPNVRAQFEQTGRKEQLGEMSVFIVDGERNGELYSKLAKRPGVVAYVPRCNIALFAPNEESVMASQFFEKART